MHKATPCSYIRMTLKGGERPCTKDLQVFKKNQKSFDFDNRSEVKR